MSQDETGTNDPKQSLVLVPQIGSLPEELSGVYLLEVVGFRWY